MPAPKCMTCAHAIFDDTTGEYTCTKYKQNIHSPGVYTLCIEYKERMNKNEQT